MSRSRDRTQGKCFSGIVSRLLCTRSLPTHPTPYIENDQVAPKSRHQSFKDLISNPGGDIFSKPSNEQQDIAKETTKPGVVARLMGLETLPPKDGNLGSYLRSRSVNFVDYLYSCDDITTGKPQHRRVKTSLSFREVTANIEKGNSLKKEKGDQILKKTRVDNYRQSKQRKVDKREGIPRNGGNFHKKKNSRISEEPRRDIYTRSSLKVEASNKRVDPERTKGGSRDVHLGLNKLKNKKKKRLANRRNPDERYPESTSSVSDSCSQDSSFNLKVNTSGHQERTSLKKQSQKYNNSDGTFNKEEFFLFSRRELDKKRSMDLDTGGYMNMLGEVRKLAEDEIARTSWMMEIEHLEEICVYISEEILEFFLDNLTDELLVEFSSRIRV